MSASLVGSEMCIRDRPPPKALAGPPTAAKGGAAGSPGGSDALGPAVTPAVSYTHLNAADDM
eukprot:2705954-Alexandrium_andersonii.AAC.1